MNCVVCNGCGGVDGGRVVGTVTVAPTVKHIASEENVLFKLEVSSTLTGACKSTGTALASTLAGSSKSTATTAT